MSDDKEAEKKEVKSSKLRPTQIIKKNPWVLISIILAILVILLIIANFSSIFKPSGKSIGKNFVDFINSRGGTEIEYVSSSYFGSGLYEVIVSSEGSEIPVYLTKDGKYFVSIIAELSDSSNEGNSNDQTSDEIPTSDKPNVKLFVMSFCPYGNLAENTMYPVYNLLKGYVDFEVHYIVSVEGNSVSSLHGQKEVDQNIRELCVKKNYGNDKFWNFVTAINEDCGSDGSCWENVSQTLGIDIQTIESCFENEGLDLMKAEAEISDEYGVSGSPTMFINEVETTSVYSYGDSEEYKGTICSAFNEVPSVCAQELTSTDSNVQGSC
ncbi:MAG: hypothetical protein WC812_00855 [Candidatus Pacearchaeota archaeon]|jgi:hypothetical protein